MINGKEVDVRKAIPREQTSRMNGFVLTNNNNINSDFYNLQSRYPPHLMINHATLPPPSFPPYAFFPPTNYLSRPMPLMKLTNPYLQPAVLPPPTFILQPESTNSALLRNQTIPSPTPPNSSSGKTNNNANYQNDAKDKTNNDETTILSDTSKNRQLNLFTARIENYSFPMRSKPR